MSNASRRLILFARFPEAGRVKTRLIPALGAGGAVRLHRRLVLRALRMAEAACQTCDAQLELYFDGGDKDAIQHWLGDGWSCRLQASGGLGERMARAFEEGFRDRSGPTLLIGSDCPGLTPELLANAFEKLNDNPVVLGPAADGGYYLVGLTRPVPELFRGISWGSDRVLAESVNNLKRIGIKPALLPELADVDRPSDLALWRSLAEAEESGPREISVIIPALNEAASIASTLEAVRQQKGPHEVIVVDAGSTDDTCLLAVGVGARVIASRPNRATQMNAGAAKATGNLFLFLHADTILPPNWQALVLETLSRPNIVAGAFGFEIGADIRGKRVVEWATNWRSHWRQMPYGDQGLFLRRELFEEEGGFADLPIMEDYEFIRRLRRRGKIFTAAERAITSGRRWRRLGVLQTTFRNKLIIAGYHLGVSPSKLASFYRKNHTITL